MTRYFFENQSPETNPFFRDLAGEKILSPEVGQPQSAPLPMGKRDLASLRDRGCQQSLYQKRKKFSSGELLLTRREFIFWQ